MDKKILIYGVPDKNFYGELKEKNIKEVFVSELRPNLQGAKLVTKELLKHKIRPILISDNMISFCMSQKLISQAYLFYERLTKNKAICYIGSLIVTIAAKRHKIPLFCWPAKEKLKNYACAKDLFYFKNFQIAPKGIKAYVPLKEEVSLKYFKRIYK